jgi:outer membrane protein assembly factor BamB
VLLGIVLLVALIAWVAAIQLEKRRSAEPSESPGRSAAVLRDGVVYEAQAGDEAVVVATDVGSGKELWRADLGSLTANPVLVIQDEVIEVQIAGTPWMTLDRATGEPVE